MTTTGSTKGTGSRAALRARPNARGRSSGRFTLQERQKQDSREKVIAAAREVFDEIPYALAAVEDIIVRAQVSRATFYKHFDSKFAVGKALHDEFWPRLFDLYTSLSLSPSMSEPVLQRWVDSMLDFYRKERTLTVAFQQMMVIEPEFTPVADRITRQVIESFGQTIPAFAGLLKQSASGRRARVDARLLFRQLDDFCYAAVIHNWTIDVQDGVRIMARNFRRLVDDIAESMPASKKISSTPAKG